MSRYWSPFVHSLDPYVPGEQPNGSDVIKLNTNESPYPPSPKVRAALDAFDTADLRLYPEPESDSLTTVIAQYHQVEPTEVFLGNGSDEVLAHIFNAFFRQDKPVLFPDITYGFYPVYAKYFDVECRKIALDEQFAIDFSAYDQLNGGVIFPNPNAPTGMLTSIDAIARLLDNNKDSVVVIDEAYIDFATTGAVEQVSAVALTQKYPNLLVTRTLSKSRALAGIRLGYAIGSSDLIDGLKRVKNSFNSYPIGSLASVAAMASFADEDYFQASRERVITGRNFLTAELTRLGFDCLPSAANFVMVRHAGMPAEAIFKQLRARNIIVRYFDKPRICEYLRITVGTESANQALVSALETICD